MKIKTFYIFICLVFGFNTTLAQADYSNIKKGIKYYSEEKYGEAEASFKKVIVNNDTIKEAYFNLGNAVYKQGRFEEARENYQKAISFSSLKKDLAETYHNIGNTYMSEKKWEESIDAYKNALKNQSKDMDTKYNLAYAELMLAKEQQQQQQQENKEVQKDKDKKESDQEKDQKGEDKNGDQKDKENSEDSTEKESKESQKKESPEDKKEEEGKSKPQKLTKEEAERLLRAIENQEQKLQDKKKQEDMTPIRIDSEKDW